MKDKWRTAFLPTLIDKFFTSDRPFDSFNIGSDEFIMLLKAIIKEVFPNFKYEVTSTDSIHFLVCYILCCFLKRLLISIHPQAYNRINEKRSNIGKSALKFVEDYLKTLESDQKVEDWLRWSMHIDGPLFFKIPTPIDSPTDSKDPHYQVSFCFILHSACRHPVAVSRGPPTFKIHHRACCPPYCS